MFRFSRSWCRAGIFLSAILAILACGCSKRTRTIHVAVGAFPERIDPVVSIDLNGNRIASHLYESLFDLNETGDGNIIPRLAREEGEYNPTRTRLTIHLRDDVLFHDGSPMTAEDVAFSLQRIVDAAGDTLMQMNVSPGLLGNPRKIRVVDTLTIEIVLPETHLALEETLATPLYTPIIRKNSGIGTDDPIPIGTGQYFLKKYSSRRGKAVLHRFEDYWGEPPIPDEIRFTAYESGEERLDAIMAGRADVATHISVNSVNRVIDSDRMELVTSTNRGWQVLGINNQWPPFDDVNMRRALAMALEVEQIAGHRWQGAGVATRFFVGENLQPDIRGREAPGFNPEAAGVLFDTVTTREWGSLVLIRSRAAEPDRTEALLNFLQFRLRDYGLVLKQEYIPDWDEYDRRVREGSWNLSLDGFSTDNGDLYSFLLGVYGFENPDGSYGLFRMDGVEFVELLNRANSTLDEDERLEIFKSAIDWIADEVPCVPLADLELFLVRSTDLQGLHPGPYPDWTFARVTKADWK